MLSTSFSSVPMSVNLVLPIPFTAVSIKSMHIHRILNIKGAVPALFLLTILASQIQVVFACDLMDGQPKPVCCCGDDMTNGCEMGGGCNRDGAMALSPDCCDVSVVSLTDVSIGSPMSTASQVVLQNAPRPPPLALCTVTSELPSKFGSVSLPVYYPTNRHFVRTEIYLDTQRLRI